MQGKAKKRPIEGVRDLNGGQMASAALGLVHLFGGGGTPCGDHFDKAVKKVSAVVGAGAGLRMILDGKNGFLGVSEAFEGLVVEVDVGGFAACFFEAFKVDGKTVVLAGDFDFAGAKVLDGLVAAAVAKLKFVGVGSQGTTEQLIAKADAKNGQLANELFEVANGGFDGGGVAWSIGDKQAVGLVFGDGLWACVLGQDVDVAACIDEVSKNIEFGPAV